MPTLTEVYKSNAKYVRDSGFTVTVDTRMGTVAIEDESGEGFFLQDSEGYQWIDEAREVWARAEHLELDDAFYGHAKQYIDCL